MSAPRRYPVVADHESYFRNPTASRISVFELGLRPRLKAGVVTRVEAPRLLAHTWIWDGNQTEVTYQLAERGSQVLLTIVHRNLGKAKELVPRVMGGWDVHTGILEDLLEGVPPRSFWSTWTKASQQYAQENAAAIERA